MKRLSPFALRVLGSMKLEGLNAKIAGQLDRKLYLEVNEALEALGGKWNRKLGAHVFTEDPEGPISQVIASGGFIDKKQELGFFQTPDAIADQLVARLGIPRGAHVLEPSAGHGRIAEAIRRVGASPFCVEIDPANVATLRSKGFAVHQGDFLHLKPEPFNFVVMNPPFAKQLDIAHVTHALSFLRPGGQLVAIMSAGVLFRENSRSLDFRALVNRLDGEIVALPSGSFAPEGTNVETVMVLLTKE